MGCSMHCHCHGLQMLASYNPTARLCTELQTALPTKMAVVAIHGGIIWTCFSCRQNFVKTSSVPPSKYRGGGSTLARVRQNIVEHLCRGCKVADYLRKKFWRWYAGVWSTLGSGVWGIPSSHQEVILGPLRFHLLAFQASHSKQWSSGHWVCWTCSAAPEVTYIISIFLTSFEKFCANCAVITT